MKEVTVEQHDQWAAELRKLCDSIIAAKRPAYTRESRNVYANFDRIALDVDTSAEKVLWTYMKKQLDSILACIRNPELYTGEPFETRIADAVNYLTILYGMAKRREGDALLPPSNQHLGI